MSKYLLIVALFSIPSTVQVADYYPPLQTELVVRMEPDLSQITKLQDENRQLKAIVCDQRILINNAFQGIEVKIGDEFKCEG